MTPKDRREMREKATRILESDRAELFRALIDVLYDFTAKERAAAKRTGTVASGQPVVAGRAVRRRGERRPD